jgi:aromatic ring hydroxylase
MKNNPLTTVLLGVLTVSAMLSALLCCLFITNTRQKNELQSKASEIIMRNNLINALANDTLEYSKKNPAIDPILESVGLKPGKSAQAAPSKPATK